DLAHGEGGDDVGVEAGADRVGARGPLGEVVGGEGPRVEPGVVEVRGEHAAAGVGVVHQHLLVHVVRLVPLAREDGDVVLPDAGVGGPQPLLGDGRRGVGVGPAGAMEDVDAPGAAS